MKKIPKSKRGQCLCGAVTFTANVLRNDFTVCHCRMCQRWSGGVFLTTPATAVRFDGEDRIRRYRSSDWAERGFCNECGSLLFYRLLKSDEYEICSGAFDDQSDLELTAEIFMDQKPGGYALAGDHPRLTDAETLEKFKAFAP